MPALAALAAAAALVTTGPLAAATTSPGAPDSITVQAPATASAPARTTSTAALPTKAPVTSSKRRSGMWVWTWTDPDNVVTFASTHNVTDIYIYNNPIDQTQQQQSVLLARKTRAAGLMPVAMGGDPSWVNQPGVAETWARTVTATGAYSGVHLEVEAHSTPTWSTNKEAAISNYVQCVTRVTKATRLPVDVSVPWWYHQETSGAATVTDAIARVADTITLVTYNNTAAGINEFAAGGAAIATKHRVPFRLASETNTGPGIPAWLTFSGHTQTDLQSVQRAVATQWSGNKYFAGFATHDYTGWQQLPD